ncbi:MAG: cytochrome c oxidase assembly protein [Candidatus Promineifilaceae bacterium]
MVTSLGWIGRASVVLLIVCVGAVYARGLAMQHADEKPSQLQIASFLLGLLLLLIALTSRLEDLVSQFFTARAFQQLLITEPIPFLLMAANPYPVLKVGAGRGGRILIDWLKASGGWRHNLAAVTRPGFVWAMFVMLFWFWHDESMIAASNQYGLVHALEVVSLFGFATLYWWHIAAVAPYLHTPLSSNVRIFYAFLGILPIKLTGIVMLFGLETVVGGYRTDYAGEVMLQWGDGLQFSDNSAGAILIWVIGGIMYALAVTTLGGRALSIEEAKPELPQNPLLDDSLWAPPGIGAGAKNRLN